MLRLRFRDTVELRQGARHWAKMEFHVFIATLFHGIPRVCRTKLHSLEARLLTMLNTLAPARFLYGPSSFLISCSLSLLSLSLTLLSFSLSQPALGFPINFLRALVSRYGDTLESFRHDRNFQRGMRLDSNGHNVKISRAQKWNSGWRKIILKKRDRERDTYMRNTHAHV